MVENLVLTQKHLGFGISTNWKLIGVHHLYSMTKSLDEMRQLLQACGAMSRLK